MGGWDIGGVASEGIIGRSADFILMHGVAERWTKSGVVTVVMWIKRKWSKLCRKRVCNPDSIYADEL